MSYKVIIWDFNNTIYDPSTEKLFPFAKELLEKFHRNFKQLLFSTVIDRERRINLIKSFGIWEYFDEVDIGIKTLAKFKEVLKTYDCDPSEVLVIGDSIFNEIRLGEKLGMKTIWIERKPLTGIKTKLFKVRYWKKVEALEDIPLIMGLSS